LNRARSPNEANTRLAYRRIGDPHGRILNDEAHETRSDPRPSIRGYSDTRPRQIDGWERACARDRGRFVLSERDRRLGLSLPKLLAQANKSRLATRRHSRINPHVFRFPIKPPSIPLPTPSATARSPPRSFATLLRDIVHRSDVF
jgi:hypothetical protein